MKGPVLYKKTAYHVHPQFYLDPEIVWQIGHGKRNFFSFMADLKTVFNACKILFSHSFYQEKQKFYAKSRVFNTCN